MATVRRWLVLLASVVTAFFVSAFLVSHATNAFAPGIIGLFAPRDCFSVGRPDTAPTLAVAGLMCPPERRLVCSPQPESTVHVYRVPQSRAGYRDVRLDGRLERCRCR